MHVMHLTFAGAKLGQSQAQWHLEHVHWGTYLVVMNELAIDAKLEIHVSE